MYAFVHPGSELRLNYFREGSVSLLVPISTNPRTELNDYLGNYHLEVLIHLGTHLEIVKVECGILVTKRGTHSPCRISSNTSTDTF